MDDSGVLYIRAWYITIDVLVKDEDIHSDPEYDLELIWEGGDEDGVPIYCGTRVAVCTYCLATMARRTHELMVERILGNWDVRTCPLCADISNHPYN